MMDLTKESAQTGDQGNTLNSGMEVSAACAGINFMDCIGAVRTMGELCE